MPLARDAVSQRGARRPRGCGTILSACHLFRGSSRKVSSASAGRPGRGAKIRSGRTDMVAGSDGSGCWRILRLPGLRPRSRIR